MVVRRNDSRRRRVVVDPTLPVDETGPQVLAADDTQSRREGTPYSSGANRRHQKKTTDLIPKRVWPVALVVVLLLAAVGILNVLAICSSQWTARIGTEGVAALRLTGRATLAGWFASFLLIMAGLASLQVYALRQHRRDDYRGSYRLWLWMAMLLVIGSVNCVVDLSTIGSRLFQSVTSISVAGSVWWVLALKLGLLSLLVSRGIFEIRESRGTLTLVCFVWAAYIGAVILQTPVSMPNVVVLDHDLVLGNFFLIGTVCLVLAELTFARFIYLQAHGLIKPRVAKPKQAKSKTPKLKVRAEKPAAGKKSTKPKPVAEPVTDTDISEPPVSDADDSNSKSIRRKKTKSDSQKTDSLRINEPESNDEEDESVGILKISKAERRRQKKQTQQHRRAA